MYKTNETKQCKHCFFKKVPQYIIVLQKYPNVPKNLKNYLFRGLFVYNKIVFLCRIERESKKHEKYSYSFQII